MFTKSLNAALVAIGVVLSVPSVLSPTAAVGGAIQPVLQEDDAGDAARAGMLAELERQASDLICQRAAVLQVNIPALSLRGRPASRHFNPHWLQGPASEHDTQSWRSHLPRAEDGAIVLDLPQAYRLATIHCDAYQRRVESLLMTALRVVERKLDAGEKATPADKDTDDQAALDREIRRFAHFRRELISIVASGQPCCGPLSPRTDARTAIGTSPLGGFLGLVQQDRWITLTRRLLAAHEVALPQLESYYVNALIDLATVDSYRQKVEEQRAELHAAECAFQQAIDTFTVQTLGLPAGLAVRLKDPSADSFELVDPSALDLLQRLRGLCDKLGRAAMDDDESARNIEAALPLVLDQWETYIRLIEGDLRQLEQSSAENVTGGVGVEPGSGRSAGPDFRSEVDAVRAGVARFREHLRQLDDDEISAGNATDRGGLLLSWVSHLTREMSRSTFLQATIRLGLPRCKAAARPFDEAFRLARINDPLVQEQLERVQELEQFLHSVPLDGDDERNWTIAD